jgi:hypothetical protein
MSCAEPVHRSLAEPRAPDRYLGTDPDQTINVAGLSLAMVLHGNSSGDIAWPVTLFKDLGTRTWIIGRASSSVRST